MVAELLAGCRDGHVLQQDMLLQVGLATVEPWLLPAAWACSTALRSRVALPVGSCENHTPCTATGPAANKLHACLPPPAALQFEDELAVVKRRRVVAHIALSQSPALVPALEAPLPLAVHATAAAPAAAPLLLRGRLLTDESDLILARQQGCNLTGGRPHAAPPPPQAHHCAGRLNTPMLRAVLEAPYDPLLSRRPEPCLFPGGVCPAQPLSALPCPTPPLPTPVPLLPPCSGGACLWRRAGRRVCQGAGAGPAAWLGRPGGAARRLPVAAARPAGAALPRRCGRGAPAGAGRGGHSVPGRLPAGHGPGGAGVCVGRVE